MFWQILGVTNLTEKYPIFVAHGKGEEADVPRFMFNGIFSWSQELEN
jgi:hypothetical protein